MKTPSAFSRLPAFILLLSIFSGAAAHADESNPLFHTPHLLSSPYTLSSGSLVLGSYSALGVGGFLEIGSDLLRDAYGFYNVNLKVSLISGPQFAFALTGGMEWFNYQDLNPNNLPLEVTSYQPGAVMAVALLDELALFLGGNLNFTEAKLEQEGLATYGFTRGAMAEADLAWAYAGRQGRLGLTQALSFGVNYDFTYRFYGVGVSHFWRGFKLGVHFYPQADENRVLPIIAGGATVSL